MNAPAPRLDSDFVAAALSAQLRGRCGPAAQFERAVIDSRRAGPGDLFVALPGEHVDGHDFAAAAVARGASGVLLSRAVAGTEGAAHFLVPDTLAALQRLAVAWRDALPSTEVVGITGNVGKTTAKLLTAAVLASTYRVQANEANYNNEIGVPLCLLELKPETQRAVIEMGMYTTGEIALLCTWARPRIGVVLNVGPVHLERAGSLEAIARAKREIIEGLPAGGHAILNADDEVVRAMAPHTSARVWFTGSGPDADVRGSDVESRGEAGFEFTLTHRGQSRRVRVPLPGRHLLPNVLAAAAVGLADGLPFEVVASALERLQVPLRLTVRRLRNGATVLDDTYNASPAATLGALELLAEMTPPASGGRRLALLGDMRELGPLATAEHERVGRRAAEVVDGLYTVGELARDIARAAREAGLSAAVHFDSREAAAEALRSDSNAGDLLLVKGSRALALEHVVSALVDAAGGEDVAAS